MANLDFKKPADDSPEAQSRVRPSDEVSWYLNELKASRKREEKWKKNADNAVELYEGDGRADAPFNILYSNTETLSPALYNQLPRPVVQRRHKDADPVGATAAKLTQRVLAFLLDANDQDYSNFDDMMKSAVLEGLVPGRGVTRFKYDASFEQIEVPEAGEATPDTGESPAVEAAEPQERVAYETVCGEEIPWDRFHHGYAKKWKDVPWIAIEHFLTREELVKTLGKTVGNAIPLTETKKQEGKERTDDENENVKLGHVYEIWDKVKKEVIFICPASPVVAKRVPDPLELSGFYPIPRPMGFFARVSGLCPQVLYELYRTQAEELNVVTTRIKVIVKALKVRGFYNGELDGLDKVLEADDNVLIPAENVLALQQGQQLANQIWLMPLNELVNVLQQLFLQRQQIKTIIYEITGVSDILRGSSVASETATAQNIKNQWGTLRLKRMQKEVMRYVRDSLRIMAEIAMTKLSAETLAAMSGMQIPTEEQKAQLQQVVQQLQASGQPMPEDFAGMQGVLAQPSWEQLQAILRNDLQRNYHIDIETNSTVDAEATEDKEQMGEYLNAVAQFLNGVAPMVEQGIMPFDAAKAILLAVTRRYRFGTEVEDEIKLMKPVDKGSNPAEMEKAQQELQKAQADVAKKQQELEQQAMEQAQAQSLAAQQAEMEKQFTLREIEAQKQFASRELEMEKRFALQEIAAAKQLAESSVKQTVKQQGQQAQGGGKKSARITPE